MILNLELCPPPSLIDIVLYFLCNILIFASYLPFHPLIKDITSTTYRLANSMILSDKRINEKFWHWVRSKGTNEQTQNLHRKNHT